MNTPRRIWLTGASNGLGAELAEQLLNSGVHLAVSARTVEPLQTLVERFPEQVLWVPGDLSDSEQVKRMGEQITQAWGSLDTVILNAGTCEYVDAKKFDASVIERVVKSNLLASSYCIEAALPLLRLGREPHLVGVASSLTYLPLTRAEAYGASKASLRSLFESLRLDLAHEGIDVTVVSPGFIDTPLTAKNDVTMPLMWTAEKAARHILERLDARPLEIAFPALCIASLWPLSPLAGHTHLPAQPGPPH